MNGSDLAARAERQEVDPRMLVEEQAALNRVAVTVATESAAERVFDVVTEEVARLLGADAANLVCFSPTFDEGIIVGKWSEPSVQIPGAGTVVAIADGSALARVARKGAPARMATNDPEVPPELHERLIALGVTSLVAAPIVVSGEIWGALPQPRRNCSPRRAMSSPSVWRSSVSSLAGSIRRSSPTTVSRRPWRRSPCAPPCRWT